MRTDHKKWIWKNLLQFTFNSDILISFGNFFSKLRTSFWQFDTFICTKSPMVAAQLLRQFKSVWFNVLFSHSLAYSTTSYFGVFSLRWSIAFCLRFVDGIWFYCVWLCNRDLLLMILTWQRVTSNGSIAMKLATGQVEQYTQIFTPRYLYRYWSVRERFSALALPMQNLHCLRF